MKNLTKLLSYFFIFMMLGFAACKSSDSVDPISIVGKWKMTAITITPMLSGITQKDLDGIVDCNKSIIYEITTTKITTTGKNCYGSSFNEQYDYTIAGGKLTDKSTGKSVDISISGNTFTTSNYDLTDKTTTKATYTRL